MKNYLILLFASLVFTSSSKGQRNMEFLDRAVVAVKNPVGKVFISWRLLATDPQGITFNVYRKMNNGKIEKQDRNEQ